VTPLTALLSHALVAFTIEFDNAAETRMPHRTTRFEPTGGQPAGPWLISLAFWANCLRPLVAADAISTRDLERAAGTMLNLRPMTRWGYATIDAGKVVRPTSVGRRADAIWRDLLPEIEGRWRDRLGADRFDRLIAALRTVDAAVGAGLPDALPTLGFGLWSTPRDAKARPIVRTGAPASDLAALLSRALLASAMAYEATSAVSLAIAANVLRLAAEPVALRTVPDAAGISREAVVMAVTALDAGGFGHADTDGPKREPRLGLTERASASARRTRGASRRSRPSVGIGSATARSTASGPPCRSWGRRTGRTRRRSGRPSLDRPTSGERGRHSRTSCPTSPSSCIVAGTRTAPDGGVASTPMLGYHAASRLRAPFHPAHRLMRFEILGQ
jgi:hypothetical protein